MIVAPHRGTADPLHRQAEAARFCRDILPSVSRTFALSIRVLPGALGRAVLVAYLLCRIADTVEDAPGLSAERKSALLDSMLACFDDAAEGEAFPARTAEIDGDPGHARLTRHANLVFLEFSALPAGSRAHVRRWVTEMVTGMRTFVLRYPQGIRIQSLDEYREYCYYVAGTVGYMLTDLWHEHWPIISDARHAALRERCRAFAEALQTVNILKDVARDAEHENSIFIPEQLLQEHGSSHAMILAADRARQTRDALGTLARLASQDLEHAQAYLLAIPRRAMPIRLFCALPLLFACATLRDLRRTWAALAQAPLSQVVKISRAEVKSLTILSVVGVASNHMLAWLAAQARRRPLTWAGARGEYTADNAG
ncbi:MAG TPA: squalene/phytoene synthase family protein [Gemmatimonadaceae bacterium]|nr:squalene/phytoene synthase family protein [Gemmatimonadaceae bacterium]